MSYICTSGATAGITVAVVPLFVTSISTCALTCTIMKRYRRHAHSRTNGLQLYLLLLKSECLLAPRGNGVAFIRHNGVTSLMDMLSSFVNIL